MAEEKKGKEKEPKIIVDDDWKAQAKAEKERLAKEAEERSDDADQTQARRLPPASFSSLVSSLVAQVFLALGGMEDPRTKKRYVDLDLAKHHIDVLAVIEQKTSGNLTDEEKKLLDQALYETRMQYVQIAQDATRET